MQWTEKERQGGGKRDDMESLAKTDQGQCKEVNKKTHLVASPHVHAIQIIYMLIFSSKEWNNVQEFFVYILSGREWCGVTACLTPPAYQKWTGKGDYGHCSVIHLVYLVFPPILSPSTPVSSRGIMFSSSLIPVRNTILSYINYNVSVTVLLF